MRGRDGSLRSSRPVYSKLLSGLHCVPLCLWLTRGSEYSLVQAKVMSTQRHINTQHTGSQVTDNRLYMGARECTICM